MHEKLSYFPFLGLSLAEGPSGGCVTAKHHQNAPFFRRAFLHHFLIFCKTSAVLVTALLLQLGCPVACPWAERWAMRWEVSSPALPFPGDPKVWGEQLSRGVGSTGGCYGCRIGGRSGWEPWVLGLAGLLCPACRCLRWCPHCTPIRLTSFCSRKRRHARAPKTPISSSFSLPLWQG